MTKYRKPEKNTRKYRHKKIITKKYKQLIGAGGPIEVNKPIEFEFKKRRILGLGKSTVKGKFEGKTHSKINLLERVKRGLFTQTKIDQNINFMKKLTRKHTFEKEKIKRLTKNAETHKQEYEKTKQEYEEFRDKGNLQIQDIQNWGKLTEGEKTALLADLKLRGFLDNKTTLSTSSDQNAITKEITKSIDTKKYNVNRAENTKNKTKKNLEFSLLRLKKNSAKFEKIQKSTNVGQTTEGYDTLARQTRQRNFLTNFFRRKLHLTYTAKQYDILADISTSNENVPIKKLKEMHPDVDFSRSFQNEIAEIQGKRKKLNDFVEGAKESMKNTDRLISQGSNAISMLKKIDIEKLANTANIEEDDYNFNKNKKENEALKQIQKDQKEKLTKNMKQFSQDFLKSFKNKNKNIQDILNSAYKFGFVDFYDVKSFDEFLNKVKTERPDKYQELVSDPSIRASYDNFIREKALELPDTQRTFLLAEVERVKVNTETTKLGITVDNYVEKVANADGYPLNIARIEIKKQQQYSNLSTKKIAQAIKLKQNAGQKLNPQESNFINEYNKILESGVNKYKKEQNSGTDAIQYPNETPNVADLTSLTAKTDDTNVSELTALFTDTFKNAAKRDPNYSVKEAQNKALYGNTIGELLTQLEVSDTIPSDNVKTKLENLLNAGILSGKLTSTNSSTIEEMKANLIAKFEAAMKKPDGNSNKEIFSQ